MILERVGPVAYILALEAVHNAFYVSMLSKYTEDPIYVLRYKDLPWKRI